MGVSGTQLPRMLQNSINRYRADVPGYTDLPCWAADRVRNGAFGITGTAITGHVVGVKCRHPMAVTYPFAR